MPGIAIAGALTPRLKPLIVAGGGSAPAPGVSASAPSIAPSIQYHPNTSTLTMRADSTFSGYIVPVSGVSDVSMLVVTTYSATTSQALKYGLVLIAGGAAAGTMILSPKANEGVANGTSATTGTGGLGRYLVTGGNQTVGSSGSPVVFTAAAQQVVGMSDLKGRADLSSLDNKGPELKVDAYGRKFLRFTGDTTIEWLRNITITGLDTHNIAWFLVGRFPNAGKTTQYTGSNSLVSTGAFELGGVPAQCNALGQFGNFPGNPIGGTVSTGTAVATAKRMMFGSQMQVVGSSTASADGLGAAGTSATGRTWLNETSVSAASSPARGSSVTGLTVNSKANGSGGTNGTTFDLYELNGYVLGELGTPTTSQARGDAIVATIMTNYAIPAITKSLVLLGDSRTEYGGNSVVGTTGSPNEPLGTTVSSILTEPGPNALPADVRVTSWAAGGEGVGYMNAYLEQGFANFSVCPSPLNATWMFGGGKDYFAMLSGTNDIGSGGTGGLWPALSSGPNLGGTQVGNSSSYIDDLYNGPGYSVTFDATVASGGQSVTAANLTPSFVYDGMVFTGTNWAAGAYSSNYRTASPLSLGFQQPTALTAVATTGFLGGYQYVVGKLLQRGFKGVWLAEWERVSPYFRAKVTINAKADALAGTGQTYDGKLAIGDPSLISIGGKFTFAADGVPYGYYLFDLIHMNTNGKRLLIEGGDTPQYGYRSYVKAILAT